MKSKLKVLIVVVLTFVIGIPGTMALGGCGKKDDANTFTIWLSPNQGVSEYYTDLTQSPVMQYLNHKFGINLKFEVPSGNVSEKFTLLTASGDYPDVMELSSYYGAVVDLVTDGVALELTDYINGSENLFPNYKSRLKDMPSVDNAASTLDKKYLSIYSINDAVESPWGGFMYRKDLVLKYAKASDSFVLNGETINPTTWKSKDDVIFPSGAKAPDLISDYDWMFVILKRAVDANELKYCMSLYFPGYLETGEIVSAFGASSHWAAKEDPSGNKTVSFGGDSPEFKSYVSKMKEWYSKGYIDSDFSSKKNDMFFSIDTNSISTGKVGCFYGTFSFIGNQLAGVNGSPETLDLRAAYMPRLSKDMEPSTFYGATQVSRSWMISSKVVDKNYDKLFAAMDYLYGEEGSMIVRGGLNKQQYAELIAAGYNPALSDKIINLTDEEKAIAGVSESSNKLSDIGAYYWNEEKQTFAFWKDIEANPANENVEVAITGMSFFGCRAESKLRNINQIEAVDEARFDIWQAYKNTDTIDDNIIKKLNSEQSDTYYINYNSIKDYMSTEVPKFIKGLRPLDDSNWKNFSNNIKLKGSATNTTYLQSVYDIINAK